MKGFLVALMIAAASPALAAGVIEYPPPLPPADLETNPKAQLKWINLQSEACLLKRWLQDLRKKVADLPDQGIAVNRGYLWYCKHFAEDSCGLGLRLFDIQRWAVAMSLSGHFGWRYVAAKEKLDPTKGRYALNLAIDQLWGLTRICPRESEAPE